MLPAATPKGLGRSGTGVGRGSDGRGVSKAVLVVGEGQDGEAGEAAGALVHCIHPDLNHLVGLYKGVRL